MSKVSKPEATSPETWLLSNAVAKILGVKTGTLARWRCTGRGPTGWKRRARTVVAYPRSAVEEFLERQGEAEVVDAVPPMRPEGMQNACKQSGTGGESRA